MLSTDELTKIKMMSVNPKLRNITCPTIMSVTNTNVFTFAILVKMQTVKANRASHPLNIMRKANCHVQLVLVLVDSNDLSPDLPLPEAALAGR